MSTTTLQLKTPIQQGEERLTEITFRRPKAGDMRRAMKDIATNPFSALLDLASAVSMTPLPAKLIDELDIEDAMAITGLMGDFFPDGPVILKTP